MDKKKSEGKKQAQCPERGDLVIEIPDSEISLAASYLSE